LISTDEGTEQADSVEVVAVECEEGVVNLKLEDEAGGYFSY